MLADAQAILSWISRRSAHPTGGRTITRRCAPLYAGNGGNALISTNRPAQTPSRRPHPTFSGQTRAWAADHRPANHWDRGLDFVVEGEARPETLGLAYAEM